MNKNHPKIIVFYDGKCGLCAKEINHYRKVAPNEIFDWQDVTNSTAVLEQTNISLAESLKKLHVIDLDGELHIGVDAFIVIWRQLKRWKILAFFVSLPIVRQVANFAYRVFANWRFKRLTHCQLALANEVRR